MLHTRLGDGFWRAIDWHGKEDIADESDVALLHLLREN